MNILFIAPIPPPINGQSKAAKVLLDALEINQSVEVVNLSKTSLKNNETSLSRFFDILKILKKVNSIKKNKDIIYLSLAESFLGNMRDLIIYFLIRRSLGVTYIHMLGGAGMKEILSGTGWQKKINSYFMKKLAGVIVEGPVNYETFEKVIPKEKIHIVPNFAEDFLFATDEEINKKFDNLETIQILYLSNLIPGKGYDELVDAYLSLSKKEQTKIVLKFVGGFESQESEQAFTEKIKNSSNINYLGKFIDGEEKRELYCKSHVFCLPTYYPFEGQPISILEAYATGCVVITSNHSGIPFIFKDKENGFIVEKKSILSLSNALKQLTLQKHGLKKIAFHNRDVALQKYRTDIYQKSIVSIFSSQ